MESSRRWWLAAVAALVAVAYLFESVGPEAGLGLLVATIAGAFGYRYYRGKRPAPGPQVICLRCGETLSATARQCRYCGSASWSYRN